MFNSYLVDTNKAQTQGGQNLNDGRAAVVSDWVIGLQLWHYTLPAHMLTHQGTKVAHHKCTLLHLRTQETLSCAEIVHKSNFGKHFNSLKH